MRRLYILSLLIVVLCTSWVQSETVYEDEAEEAYRQGDFVRAIELYEQFPSDSNQGFRTYTSYFNLGQAYSQVGNWGRAILNYHRALLLAPRDADIIDRIATVRAIRPDGYAPETGILEQIGQVTTFFATWELEFFAMIIWSITWWVGLRFWLNPTKRKRLLVVGLIFITTAMLILTVSRLYIEAYRPLAIVTEAKIEVLSGAGLDYFPMFSLSTGAEVRIVARNGIWAKISLPDGREGWVRINTITAV
ncbi:MAG: tetratricopeptide repeat protein [bacterium]|nr:tetratricopeptide repeat protein [bacterium]